MSSASISDSEVHFTGITPTKVKSCRACTVQVCLLEMFKCSKQKLKSVALNVSINCINIVCNLQACRGSNSMARNISTRKCDRFAVG
jgi:hypothetical protein